MLEYSCMLPMGKGHYCLPALGYAPMYFFSRYPLETTKVWNLVKLLTPISWIWTFAAIISIVIMLKCFTLIGTYLGCNTSVQDITLVPFRLRLLCPQYSRFLFSRGISYNFLDLIWIAMGGFLM